MAFIYAAQWRETFETVREPKRTYPFTTIKVKGLEKKPDGTFRVNSYPGTSNAIKAWF
jgi:hypothetical protein